MLFIDGERSEKIKNKSCSDIFKNRKNAKFAIGRLGISALTDEMSGLGDSYFRFRADVYKKVGIFDQYDCPSGIDVDDDDIRSEHFLAIENVDNESKIVGTVRLIEKSERYPDLLPVEHMFNGHFFGNHAVNNSAEVSRLIINHDDKKSRGVIRNGLMFSTTAAAIDRDIEESYSVVEPYLEERLHRLGVETQRVTDMSHLPKYNTYNVGLKMDYRKFAKMIGKDAIDRMNIPKNNFLYFDGDGNGIK